MALLVGAYKSSKMGKIGIPQAIAVSGRDILEMRSQTGNKEKLIKKMVDLENQNKLLRGENRRLEQREKRSTEAIAKFEEKILQLTDEVKSRSTVSAQLERDLDRLKKRLASPQNLARTKTPNPILRLKAETSALQEQKERFRRKYFRADHLRHYYKQACENILFLLKSLVDQNLHPDRLMPLVSTLCDNMSHPTGGGPR